MANWHGLLRSAARTIRRSRTAMAVLGAAIAGASPAGDSRTRHGAPRLVWEVAGEGRGTPALDASTAYFLSKHHEVVAVDRATGAVRWSHHTGEPGQTTAGSTLLVAGGVVIAGDYNVVAFDRASGVLGWRFVPVDGYGPGIYLGSTAGGLAFSGSPAGRLYAIDVSSGHLRWSAGVSLGEESTVYAPVVDRDLVVAAYMRFTAPGAGGLVAWEAGSGTERWRASFPAEPGRGSRPAGGPIVVDGWVVAASGDGTIHAFDRRDGTPRWTIPPLDTPHLDSIGGYAQDFRALARAGPLLLAGSLTGIVAAYRLATRSELWRRAVVDASTAFGIVCDDRVVYVPHLSGHLVALGLYDGSERWRIGNGPGFRWPPAIEGGRFYLSGSTGGFLAFTQSG